MKKLMDIASKNVKVFYYLLCTYDTNTSAWVNSFFQGYSNRKRWWIRYTKLYQNCFI